MLLQNKILAELNSLSLSSITETHTGATLKSEEFKAAIAERIKSFTTDYNLKEGDRVVLLQNNSIEFFINFMALFVIGAVAIPLDKNIKKLELDNVVKSAGPCLVIRDEGIERQLSDVAIGWSGIALVLYTSGTTSVPKGVLISKKALLRKMEVMSKFIPASDIENTLCFIPTFFGHGLICNSLFPMFFGNNFFISPRMDLEFAANFSEILERYRINFFSSVPSHWELILGFAKRTNISFLRRVHCASAPLKKEKIMSILHWLGGTPFFDIYGATEMLGWFASRRVSSDEYANTFAEFWDAECCFSSEQELLVNADYMFAGYWSQGKVEVVDFFNTGDIFLNGVMVGRSKNTIIKNGIKIYTDELNSELLRSQIVEDVATFPIDDKFTGERVGVFVVLRKGNTIEQFKAYCRENLSTLKVPSTIIEIQSIPTNARGKVSLKELKIFFELNYKKQNQRSKNES